MIEAVSGYMKTIGAFLIFSTMVEMIVPNTKYKQYISMVLGFVLIFIVIQPVGQLLGGVKNNKVTFDWEALYPEESQNEYAHIDGTQEEIVRETFNKSLEEQVKTLIDPMYEGELLSVTVVTGDDYTIKTVSILLSEGGQGATGSNDTWIKVDPVKIGPIVEGQKEEEDAELKNIKNIISDFYNLSVDNIHITVQKKN